MATITTTFSTPGFFARFWAGIAEGFENHAIVMSRRGLIDQLEAKTDAELAEMGLKREDIMRHVFQDLFYA